MADIRYQGVEIKFSGNDYRLAMGRSNDNRTSFESELARIASEELAHLLARRCSRDTGSWETVRATTIIAKYKLVDNNTKYVIDYAEIEEVIEEDGRSTN